MPFENVELLAERPARPPRQDRSRASFERMINAAEALMSDLGSDEFTLQEVARVGKVSIGSIYNRFKSKEELIHAVHARMIVRLGEDRKRLVMHVRARGSNLIEKTYALMDELAESLARFAPLMRPMMLRASNDPVVQGQGSKGYWYTVDMLSNELLQHRDEIRHPDPERACPAAIHIAYAALARELGFGMAERPQRTPEWDQLKRDVAYMTVSFLCYDPPASAPKA